ncbi:MAG: hypothetical protein DCF20_09180 [Pseudanabaena sp.]|nr:MAG: hypothetical protein DCF20_09180 [Pseudanabaena sp.]
MTEELFVSMANKVLLNISFIKKNIIQGHLQKMKKKRHHYVWRDYLRAWSVNEFIWCYREGKIFNSNLMGVGQIKYFYKLKEMTVQDMEFIRMVAIEPCSPHLQELNEGWLNWFNYVFDLKKNIESLNNS